MDSFCVCCCRGLCDTKAAGKLNSDQFALAMHLVQQKLKGVDPPAVLSPDMIPPSLRSFTIPVCHVSVLFVLCILSRKILLYVQKSR